MGKVKKGVRVLCSVLCAAAVAVSFAGIPARANDQDEVSKKQQELAQIKEENEKRKQEIDGLDGDIAENEKAIELVNNQIDGYLAEISAYGELITAKQDAVEQKKAEIAQVVQGIADKETEIENKKTKAAELSAQNKANLEKFGKLARYMYMNDMSTTLPVLNGSDDWYEYFVYSDLVNNITKQNADFMDEINASIKQQETMVTELNNEIAALETEKKTLENEQAALEQQQTDLENEKNSAESSAAQKRAEIDSYVAQNEAFKDKISGLKTDIAEAEAEMEAINAEIEELIRKAQQNRDPEMQDYSGDGLRWPLDPQHHRITTYFGYDAWRGGHHSGIDICDNSIEGATVYAAQSGTVITVSHTCSHNYGKRNWTCGCGGNYGNYIIIDHGGSLATLYGHLQAIYVTPGQFVTKSEAIGEVGSTGWSTAFHLHFETRVNGARVDPMGYVS